MMELVLCRLVKSVQQQGLRLLSARAAQGETVTFLNLNNLTDNAGAVKMVSLTCTTSISRSPPPLLTPPVEKTCR